MENRLDEDHKLSQGTCGSEKHQGGLGKPDLCKVNQETEDGQVELVVELEEPSELSMTVGEGDTSEVNSKQVFMKDQLVFNKSQQTCYVTISISEVRLHKVPSYTYVM